MSNLTTINLSEISDITSDENPDIRLALSLDKLNAGDELRIRANESAHQFYEARFSEFRKSSEIYAIKKDIDFEIAHNKDKREGLYLSIRRTR